MTSKGPEKMNDSLPTSAAEVTVGVDIGKQSLAIHVLPDRTSRRFANSPDGIARLIAWIRPQQPTRIVLEATGHYHRVLDLTLGEAGLPAVKVNPLQARRFAEATGKRAKTDPADAAMLARFGAALQPAIPSARDRTQDTLHELRAAREALVKDRTAALNRGHTLTVSLLKRQNSLRLKQIQRHIAAIDAEMAELRDAGAAFKRRCGIVESIPGLGSASAFALLVEMPELGSPDSKETASLGGVAPVTRQSGAWAGKSFIQGGRACVRDALYMPALVAIRQNPDMQAKY